jgi:ubiquinone/menaquinone biosynthesis C-methylase UbiE
MTHDFDLRGMVPPWGRNASEYEAFFGLADVPPSARILDCGGGPASFAAEWGNRGRSVVAADPVYRFSAEAIGDDFEATATRMLQGMQKARHRFEWDRYGSPENVVQIRRNALSEFAADFRVSGAAGRYIAARLPELPFQADSFDLVLCGHLLFLYSDELDAAMHLACIQEMLRVGPEVRIFPLLDMDGRTSVHLNRITDSLQSIARLDFVSVPFEFRPGDSRMLRIVRDSL